jgi:hypothetical protein
MMGGGEGAGRERFPARNELERTQIPRLAFRTPDRPARASDHLRARRAGREQVPKLPRLRRVDGFGNALARPRRYALQSPFTTSVKGHPRILAFHPCLGSPIHPPLPGSLLAKESLPELLTPARRYQAVDRQRHDHAGAEQTLPEVPRRVFRRRATGLYFARRR